MRTRHWLASLLGSAMWAATAPFATAQPPYDAATSGGYGAPPPGSAPYVDPGSPAAAAYPIPYSGYQAAGWPNGAVAWPQISPYEAPPVDEHSYQNGLWFNKKTFGDRRYYAMLSGTLNRFADPAKDVVGNAQAPQGFGFLSGGTNGGAGNNANNNQNFGPPLFDARHWELPSQLSSGGFLGMMGFWNPDDTGVMLTGFWASQGSAELRLGVPGIDLNNPADILRRADDLITNNGALPLLDNQLPLTTLAVVPPNFTALQVPGGAQPYDLFYHLAFQSQAYGAGAAYYTNPIYKRDVFMVRPEFGMRYLKLIENAAFEGADSGLGYTFDPTILRPTTGSETGTVAVLHSYLASNTQSQLAGPEAGLRYDLGNNDRFLIWGQSKFGLLANHSSRAINGFGILRRESQPNQVVPPESSTQFQQSETTTSVSPLFEQSLFLKSNLLSFVPVVKEMEFFERAQFQIGYTWTVVGAVYRPNQDINWRGFPEFPSITNQKSTWFLSSLSLGVEWNF